MTLGNDPRSAARELAGVLRKHQLKVVFAESCTAGLAAASLASVAGISEFFCGSAVTYRNATKSAWLDVSAAEIEEHTAVSAEVSRLMAIGVLQQTSEAAYSAAITGDLGPDAPTETDGVVFIAIGRRAGTRIEITAEARIELSTSTRTDRQTEAACLMIRRLGNAIEDGT